eukprot:UN25790
MLFVFSSWVLTYFMKSIYIYLFMFIYTVIGFWGTYIDPEFWYPNPHYDEKLKKTIVQDSKDPPMIFAKSCGRLENPENTIAAASRALSLGCSLDVDVGYTADSKIVCCNENRFLKICYSENH